VKNKTPPIAEGAVITRNIPDSQEGIDFEVRRMIKYVQHYSGDTRIIQAARHAVENCPSHDVLCESETLLARLMPVTRFVQDPTRKEFIVTPVKQLKEINTRGIVSGDCDELATLLATFLSAIGHRPRFIFGAEGKGWQHVWVQDRGVHLDLAERLPFGKFLSFAEYGAAAIW